MSESNTRKTSTPAACASLVNSRTTLSGYEVYPTALAPRRSICRGTLGTAARSSSRRLQGHSCRKRSETSNVAPPQTSREAAEERACAVKGAALTRSWVRTRVASSDWCASRMVVSVTRRPLWARTAAAHPSGPRAERTSFHPAGGRA